MSRKVVQSRLRTSANCRELGHAGAAAMRLTRGGPAWAHAGILYRWKKTEVRLFELLTHQQLRDQLVTEPNPGGPSREVICWAEPDIEKERAQLVGPKCQLVHRLHQQNAVPYGFRYHKTYFDRLGGLHTGQGEVGLTCATIVVAVLASVQVALVDPSTWEPADLVDQKARRGVINSIRVGDPAQGIAPNPEHARILEAEIEASRIRPEEVVAAAAIHPAVATFDTVQDGAAVVAERLGL
jgi:hypothetical protein